jgi:hypothetical protein
MEDAELREFDVGVVRRWREFLEEQQREMNELGVPYMKTMSLENTSTTSSEDDENRAKIMAFIEDIITDPPPYPNALRHKISFLVYTVNSKINVISIASPIAVYYMAEDVIYLLSF